MARARQPKAVVEAEGHAIELSNPDKVLYPETGFTKRQMVDYYVRVAPVLLPHLRGRPLTLKRYPAGVRGPFFYEKNCPPHRPEWVETAPVWSVTHERAMDYCLGSNLATLVWAANLADIELHVTLARSEDMDRPTSMVFDLDPGAPATILDCCEVALAVRDLLASLGLRTWVKTSGSKGLQVYVPLNTAVGYETTKPLAHAVARRLERERPEQVVSSMSRAARKGRVLVDWSQNDRHKTTVAVYSLRAKERPTVSTPVSWDEVERALERRDAAALAFETDAVLERVRRHGDLFAPVLVERQTPPALEDTGLDVPAAEVRRRTNPAAKPTRPAGGAARRRSSGDPGVRRAGAKSDRNTTRRDAE